MKALKRMMVPLILVLMFSSCKEHLALIKFEQVGVYGVMGSSQDPNSPNTTKSTQNGVYGVYCIQEIDNRTRLKDKNGNLIPAKDFVFRLNNISGKTGAKPQVFAAIPNINTAPATFTVKAEDHLKGLNWRVVIDNGNGDPIHKNDIDPNNAPKFPLYYKPKSNEIGAQITDIYTSYQSKLLKGSTVYPSDFLTPAFNCSNY